MRQREPDGSELQWPGRARVDHAAGDVHVGNRVAKQHELVVAKKIKKRSYGDGRGDLRNQENVSLGGGWAFHSRWVSSRNTPNRSLISSRVRDCRRSVPNRSTANDPMT